MKIDIEKIKKSKSTEELLNFGIINIDKPTGPTSFTVSQFVKKALDLKKTSHLGTLDPMVTGVLPVALGRACRLNEYLMHRDKVYVGIMRLHKDDVKDSTLKAEMKKLTGKIIQLPPIRSRVKRAPREREVKEFKILERDGKDVLFIADVQAGTYIRKLCSDLGDKIGGAHMLELRRTRAGIFQETHKDYPSINLYDFEKALKDPKKLREIIVPGEVVATLLPAIKIRKDVVKKVLSGSPIFPSFLEPDQPTKDLNKDDKICIFQDNRFIGCYNVINEESIFAKPEFVFN